MKSPILVLASVLADGIEYLDYELPAADADLRSAAHQMLLQAENASRQDYNQREPGDQQLLLTAESAPVVGSRGVFWLGGEGDDGGEGLRVFIVPDPILSIG